MKLEPESIVCQSRNDQVSASLDETVVMMSLERGLYYALDEVGSHIWTLIEKPTRVSAVCDSLMAAFDVGREECERDALAFLRELARDDLVEVLEPGSVDHER